jgi:hypothetical protein
MVDDILNQHLLSFVALLMTRHFIKFSECFRVRVQDTILSPETLPTSPCDAVDVSSSTRVGLIDYVSEVVTSSSSTTFSSCLILSLHLWPCRVSPGIWSHSAHHGLGT